MEKEVKYNEQKFDSIWWDNFLLETKNMSETTVFKGCILKEETRLMQSYILEILSDLARMRTNKHGYRVYIEGVMLNNSEMKQIYDSPPLKDENLKDWSVRTFGNKKFGMIINQGERFNLDLSKSIALKLKPLLEKTGMPTEGIIFTLFIGNYDKTPLGIHKDLPGKSVIHFHLGPSSKTMYTWDTEEYVKSAGKDIFNNHDIEKYIPIANKFTINEGDLYFMPEDLFHVGTQDDFSIAIGCWCYNRSKYDFALRLQTLFLNPILKSNRENLKADNNDLNDTSDINQTLALFNFPEDLKNLSFENLMKETYKDLRYSLHSNAGYRTSPFIRSKKINLNLDNMIQIEEPYKILYKESLNTEKLHVFVRGTKIELNNFENIKHLIDEINKGKSIMINQLLKILPSEWDESIGLYILNTIYKHHGVKLLN